MNRVLENLYLGDEQDSNNFWLSQEPLHTTLDLTGWNLDEKGMTPSQSFFLQNLCELINIARSQGPVLVHCHAGIDRSPFAVAVYLFEEHPFTPENAYDFVKACHPQTIIHDDWMREYVLLAKEA